MRNTSGRRASQEIRDGQPLYEAIARVAVQKALRGDRHFWTYVIERCDGKVADALQQSGEVEVIVRYDDPLADRAG